MVEIFKSNNDWFELFRESELIDNVDAQVAPIYISLHVYRMEIKQLIKKFKIDESEALRTLNEYCYQHFKNISNLNEQDFQEWLQGFFGHEMLMIIEEKGGSDKKEHKQIIEKFEQSLNCYEMKIDFDNNNQIAIEDKKGFIKKMMLDLEKSPRLLFGEYLLHGDFKNYFNHYSHCKGLGLDDDLTYSKYDRGVIATCITLAEYYRNKAGKKLLKQAANINNVDTIYKYIGYVQELLFLVRFITEGGQFWGYSELVKIINKEKLKKQVNEGRKKQGQKGGVSKREHYQRARTLTKEMLEKHPSLTNKKLAEKVIHKMNSDDYRKKFRAPPIPKHDTISKTWIPEMRKKVI